MLSSIKKGKSAELCNKEAQLGAQSSLCIQCSGNMEFAPTRKVTKLTLRLQRDQVSDVCVKKNKYTPPRITVRLDSECDQRLRMCHEF